MPGGGVDWSRPRCEPDNRPVVVLGRLFAVAVPLLGALPALWFGLPLSCRVGVRAADWLTERGLNAWLLLSAPVGLLLASAGVVGLARSGRPVWARAIASARVPVDVTATQAPVAYPLGQLVFRAFDSPAMRPAASPALVEPVPVPAALEGRWSA
jgi:hypothetical protein